MWLWMAWLCKESLEQSYDDRVVKGRPLVTCRDFSPKRLYLKMHGLLQNTCRLLIDFVVSMERTPANCFRRIISSGSVLDFAEKYIHAGTLWGGVRWWCQHLNLKVVNYKVWIKAGVGGMLGTRQRGLEPACSCGSQSVLQTFMLSHEKRACCPLRMWWRLIRRCHKDAPGSAWPHCAQANWHAPNRWSPSAGHLPALFTAP